MHVLILIVFVRTQFSASQDLRISAVELLLDDLTLKDWGDVGFAFLFPYRKRGVGLSGRTIEDWVLERNSVSP